MIAIPALAAASPQLGIAFSYIGIDVPNSVAETSPSCDNTDLETSRQ